MVSRPAEAADRRCTILVLSVRNPETDFRREFAAGLRSTGCDVTYVRLARNCLIEQISTGTPGRISPLRLVLMLASVAVRRRLVVLYSVNLGFPLFCTLLRIATPSATWIFDIHDDLLYDERGLRRLYARISLRILRRLASWCICVSPNLVQAFPNSHLVSNASSTNWIERPTIDPSRILILSNVDIRLDFDLLERVVSNNPNVDFFLHGTVARDPSIRQHFAAMCRHPNFRYEGSYDTKSLPTLLARYDVTFAPYKIDRSTFFIDPLRFYHALNSGQEIITSAIPRAFDFLTVVHICTQFNNVSDIIAGLANGTIQRENISSENRLTWEMRARELLEIIEHRR